MLEQPGVVDHRDDHFVVSCAIDARVLDVLRSLPGYRYDGGVHLLPRHWRNARTLSGLARQQRWELTQAAREEFDAIALEADDAEFYVHLVHGSAGEPLFKCRADDPTLEDKLSALPGAEFDDEPHTWIIPYERYEAWEQLRALVEEDERLDCDPASTRLLFHSDRWLEQPVPQERKRERRLAPAPAATLSLSATEIVADFEREQELLALSRSVIADAGDDLDARLMPFQRAGVRYLRKTRRAFLADDKGLGKSAQALCAVEQEHAFPLLVLCAAGTELHWQREAATWLSPSRTCAIVEDDGAIIGGKDVVIARYDVLHRVRHQLLTVRARAIIADDSRLLGNERALATRAAIELSEQAEYRFCLSNTALADQPINLLSQLIFLDRIDDLQGRNAFIERYCGPRYDVGGTRYRATHTAELEQRLRACGLCRRERQQVHQQLPKHPRYRVPVQSHAAEADAAEEQRAIEQLTQLRAAGLDPLARAQASALLGRILSRSAQRKLPALVQWVHNFVPSGELLAVGMQSADGFESLRREFPEAAFIRAHGELSVGGASFTNPYMVANANVVFFQYGAVGAAVRLLRGRHVAIAELVLDRMQLESAHALADGKGGRFAGAEWYLVGNSPVEQAVMRALERRWENTVSPGEDDLDLTLQELLPADTSQVAVRSRDARRTR